MEVTASCLRLPANLMVREKLKTAHPSRSIACRGQGCSPLLFNKSVLGTSRQFPPPRNSGLLKIWSICRESRRNETDITRSSPRRLFAITHHQQTFIVGIADPSTFVVQLGFIEHCNSKSSNCSDHKAAIQLARIQSNELVWIPIYAQNGWRKELNTIRTNLKCEVSYFVRRTSYTAGGEETGGQNVPAVPANPRI